MSKQPMEHNQAVIQEIAAAVNAHREGLYTNFDTILNLHRALSKALEPITEDEVSAYTKMEIL